jgi:single-strand DNA-binding protein
MASLNHVALIGNIGKDPEFRITQGGSAFFKFSLATSESWKDKTTGDKREETSWHRCIIWGEQAQIANKYLCKGKQVYVEGKLKYGSYEKDGVKHYTTDINVQRFLMLGKKEEGGNSGGVKADGSYDYGDPNPDTGDFEAGDLGPPLDMDDQPMSPGD